jgi:hypothetical protein
MMPSVLLPFKSDIRTMSAFPFFACLDFFLFCSSTFVL